MRSGFTLVEVLVALFLFEFGMLALAAATAVAARDLAAANVSLRAQAIARTRVEQLRSAPCPAPDAGTATTNGVREFWRVSAAGSLRIISDSVAFTLPRGRRGTHVRRAWTICAT
jgi:Tfp pilus assembly protein PilV